MTFLYIDIRDQLVEYEIVVLNHKFQMLVD
jgi:hypothetical protein